MKEREWAAGERWDWSARDRALVQKGGCYDNRFCTNPDPSVPATALEFAVIGDFNRRFTPKDPFWNGLDDGDPPEADLVDAGFGRRPPCWGGRYRQYIDHIVLSRTAATWLVPNSFAQAVYDGGDEKNAAVLSDHCPIVALLDSSRAAAIGPNAAAGPRSGGGGPAARP